MNQNPVRQNFDSIGTPGAARPGLASWAWVFYVPGVLFCILYVTCMYFTPVALVPIFGHDDGHFMRQGVELTRGHWVGGYSHMTLIKGPGLPIFLALSHFFGLPYPISIALAESGSFFLLSFVVGRLAKAPALALLILVVLLSFPWVWSGDSLRVLRDGLYTSQLFIFLALSFVTIWGQQKPRAYCAFGAGLALGLLSITREENPWLWPAAAFLIVAFFVAERRRGRDLRVISLILMWAAIGLVGVRGTILTIHYAKYKLFEVTDTGEPNFRAALRALYSVETSQRVPYLLVSREARSAIYDHSPIFARLRPLLDADEAPLKGWQEPGCQFYGGQVCGDYGAFWFVWALRDAVAMVGGYADARSASAFYREISKDIEHACESKELSCRSAPIGDLPPLVRANFVLMFSSAINVVKLITLLTPLTAERIRSRGPADMIRPYASFLHLRFWAPHADDPPDAIISGTGQTPMITLTLSAQNKIRDLYNAIWPVICPFGILAVLFSTYARLRTTGIGCLTVITWTFLILIATRIGLLSVVDATLFPAAYKEYATPAAYCLAAAIAIGLYSAVQDIMGSLSRRGQP
jgi:hypothetical protein